MLFRKVCPIAQPPFVYVASPDPKHVLMFRLHLIVHVEKLNNELHVLWVEVWRVTRQYPLLRDPLNSVHFVKNEKSYHGMIPPKTQHASPPPTHWSASLLQLHFDTLHASTQIGRRFLEEMIGPIIALHIFSVSPTNSQSEFGWGWRLFLAMRRWGKIRQNPYITVAHLDSNTVYEVPGTFSIYLAIAFVSAFFVGMWVGGCHVSPKSDTGIRSIHVVRRQAK